MDRADAQELHVRSVIRTTSSRTTARPPLHILGQPACDLTVPRITFDTAVARALVIAALAVAVVLLSSVRPAASESTCVVKYEHDRLTMHVDAVPLTDVVREIGRQTGAGVVGV